MLYTTKYKTPGELTHVPHAKQIPMFTALAERARGAEKKSKTLPPCVLLLAQREGPTAPGVTIRTCSTAATCASHTALTSKANALLSFLQINPEDNPLPQSCPL